MTMKGRLVAIFAPFLLRLAFFFNLRKPWSLLCRKLQKENARKAVTEYPTPESLEHAMKAFQYRRDPWDGSMDYVSHPEYVQAVLDDPKVSDGDCDDGHWYVANALKLIPDVEEVFFLSCGWSGSKNTSGHATAVYKYQGKWYHYDWGIHEIDDPCQAVGDVARRYGGSDAIPTFWVWESVGEVGTDRSGWQPLAISPDKLQA